jgi:hypothetical protein
MNSSNSQDPSALQAVLDSHRIFRPEECTTSTHQRHQRDGTTNDTRSGAPDGSFPHQSSRASAVISLAAHLAGDCHRCRSQAEILRSLGSMPKDMKWTPDQTEQHVQAIALDERSVHTAQCESYGDRGDILSVPRYQQYCEFRGDARWIRLTFSENETDPPDCSRAQCRVCSSSVST